jgi:phytoene/squalene synthetase
MNNVELYDRVAAHTSKHITTSYSTSFSLGIKSLAKKFHEPIYGIYGFVRAADEIVDTFHEFDKARLLEDFKRDTYQAIEDGISMNPILQSFQRTVNQYEIEHELIDTFLRSMEMDLEMDIHDAQSYETYILGSAEVVGLMCLRVFTEGDRALYDYLKAPAMSLGSAFQKVNFLRDLQDDHGELGRTYFPGVDVTQMSEEVKRKLVDEIRSDMDKALVGIKQLPAGARGGVNLAYMYYTALLEKINRTPSERMLKERIRIPNGRKFGMLMQSYLKHNLGFI